MRTLPSLAHMISPTRRSSSHHGLEASPVHELSRVTGKPEVIGSSVGLVPTNASVDRTDPLPDGQLGRSPETFDEMGTHAAVDESSNSPGLERTRKQIIGRVF